MSLEYWFMFPILVLIATIAMASGVEGATFFTSLFSISESDGRAIVAGHWCLVLGMVSTGLGEMNGYFLIQRCRVPGKVAVGTSVFIVAITALTASIGHVVQFSQAGGYTLATVLSLVLFTAPGVLIGAKLGSKEVLLQQLQGNPIQRISAALQSDDLLIMIESTYRRVRPALGRMPELIASTNWDNNMMVVNFPVR